MPIDERPEAHSWIEELLEAHADEVLRRDLRIQCELDPQFEITPGEAIKGALVGLLRFVFSTVPDGCEVYVASARKLVPVAPLGSGSVTLRWQTAGSERSRLREKVTALRPIVGNARAHIRSNAADDLRSAFEAADWDFELLSMTEDREMWACASTR